LHRCPLPSFCLLQPNHSSSTHPVHSDSPAQCYLDARQAGLCETIHKTQVRYCTLDNSAPKEPGCHAAFWNATTERRGTASLVLTGLSLSTLEHGDGHTVPESIHPPSRARDQGTYCCVSIGNERGKRPANDLLRLASISLPSGTVRELKIDGP
jgi:hypothetical protein